MKTNKLVAAGLLALSMTMAPIASLINAMPVSAATVTIDQNSEIKDHTYQAYKVFTGEASGTNLTKIEWAKGAKGGQIISLIDAESDGIPALAGAKSAADLANKLQVGGESTAKLFAKLLDDHTDLLPTPETIGENTDLSAGYYLLKDTSTPQTQNVVGLSILKVATQPITITPKNGKPGVDKQVQDNDSVDPDATQVNGNWGETADHDLNTDFKFRLSTTGLTYEKIENYDTYYLEFSDSWSEGITYGGDNTVSIKVNGEDKTDAFTIESNTTERTLSVKIQNLKTILSADGSGEISVVVEYSAQLNDNATISNMALSNKNTVELIYSNNPNSTGKGTSEPDNVFVGSLQLENLKTDADGNPLMGAGFKLRNSEGKFASFSNGVFQSWSDEGTEVTSGSDGKFLMKGIDAGVYTLVETTVPDTYTKAEDLTVTIAATSHSESPDGESATITITVNEQKADGVTVVNSKISSLPETGGMGTTMIYGVGGVMVVGAAVIYITNKRTRKE
ncbi:isopeptide-forming domain-containing fimbrial protein [Erysipelotrichaceae bacterium RD49]|nr:isopeptide-forming domain-containing fimbrial protein [Erysipelotrichaceae bacterium RD49]